MFEVFLIILGLFIVFFIWLMIWGSREENKQREASLNQLDQTFDRLNNIEGFHFEIEKRHLPINGFGNAINGIAIDKIGKKLCLIAPITPNDTKFEYKIIDWNKLIEYELVINDSTTKSSRQNVIGGAVVGGALGGGVGALIGGLSGENVTIRLIKKISLNLYINDIDNPTHRISFYSHLKGEDPSKYPKHLTASIELAEKWDGMLKVILNDYDGQ